MEQIKNLAIKIKELNGDLYYVGGMVRNELLGLPIKDVDLLVIGIDQVDLEMFLLNEYPNVKLCGKTFGVYKFKINELDIDLSLPRKERSTGSLHTEFEVELGGTLSDDLHRRDFTINAMARNVLTDELIDPYNGKHDLERQYLMTVHPNAITDDYLRALRAIQFCSRLGFKLAKPVIKAIADNIELYDTISPERIRLELDKLLTGTHILRAFNYLKYTGLLSKMLPELLANDIDEFNYMYHKFNTYHHTIHALANYNVSGGTDLEIQLALLFHDVGKVNTLHQDDFGVWHNYSHEVTSAKLAGIIMTRLTYDLKTITNVQLLIENHMHKDVNAKFMRKLFNKLGKDLVRKLLDVWYFDASSCLDPMPDSEFNEYLALWQTIVDEQPPYSLKDLAINGHDVMALGYKGREIGDVLKKAMELVLDNPELNVVSYLIEYFKKGIK